ncbi:hypothetical protein RR46_05805 [Papilio xuthus]|uniref:Uncharacterized protein n=1 Tax=Papilio xuthus TaxID=66420 RepID=A0A194PNJ0_PAPXU|nr:hypothetical protein RR46_05805 [Papilio xuthus]
MYPTESKHHRRRVNYDHRISHRDSTASPTKSRNDCRLPPHRRLLSILNRTTLGKFTTKRPLSDSIANFKNV